MNNKVQQSLEEKTALKVIAGLNNFNQDKVLIIAKAAEKANATFLDVAACPELIKNIRRKVSLPICASAIKPELFVPAVKMGADIIEIGNFDSLYNQGYKINFSDILNLTKKTRSLLPNSFLSVTIPYLLPLKLQLELVFRLEDLGVNIIQTEGKINVKNYTKLTSNLEKILPTLASTAILTNNTHLPVICASGLSLQTATLPFHLNASGIGLGTCISKLKSEEEMVKVLKLIKEQIDSTRTQLVH